MSALADTVRAMDNENLPAPTTASARELELLEGLRGGFGGKFIVPPDFAEAVYGASQRITDFATVNGARADLEGEAERYRKLGHEARELRRAVRFVELRIGELLLTQGDYGTRKGDGIGGLPLQAAWQYRQLARYKDHVLNWIRDGVISRGQLLSKIVELENANQPKLAGFGEDQPRYQVIYADPPWRYDHVETPEIRAVEAHYPTMDWTEIAGLNPPAAEDAMLFLWATNPKLREALAVLDAWGFDYKTNMAWIKPQQGMGYYVRGAHELLLIGKRGNITLPPTSARPRSWLQANRVPGRTGHSMKPPQFLDIIDAMYPGLSKLEMFIRGEAREGWHGWGYEAAKKEADENARAAQLPG